MSEYRIGLYMRLSKEDEFSHVESNSITMQRMLLRAYAQEHFPDAEVTEFADDGYTGTNFERPGVQSLLEQVKDLRINCIIVKDFSRFARDYIELGSYLEQIFPFMGVRFISVNDGYDSADYKGSVADLDVNFKNLLNDLYSKDLSVKVKTSLRSIKEQGNFVGSEAPFGYRKNPENRHRLLIEEDEAEVVRRIFSMYEGGMSSVQIAKVLNEEGVKTPAQVRVEKGLRTFHPKNGIYLWQHTIILRMLKNRAYRGDLVQGTIECRTLRGEKKAVDPEHWIVTENHHDPIIEPERFDRIQRRFSRRGTWHRSDGHVLVGRLKCGCCGRILRHSTNGHPYYWCAAKNQNGLTGCVTRAEDFFLEEVLTLRLQEHIVELGESRRLLEAEKDAARKKLDELRTKCRETERAIAENREKRMQNYERYVLGGGFFDADADEGKRLAELLKELKGQLRAAEDEVLRLEKEAGYEVFGVKKLTPELMDEYFEEIVVRAEDDVEIAWKK